MSRAAPAPFPPTRVVHVVHHSKHHSSSKNKHNDHHKHSGHGHSHSHSHTHSHSQHHRMPSPSPMSSFPIATSTSFPLPSPQFHFPTVPHRPPIRSSKSHALLEVPSSSPHVHFAVPHRPPIRSSSSNALYKVASSGHNNQSKPHPKQSTKHTLTKRPPLPVTPQALHPDFQYSKCTGRRRALCVCVFWA